MHLHLEVSRQSKLRRVSGCVSKEIDFACKETSIAFQKKNVEKDLRTITLDMLTTLSLARDLHYMKRDPQKKPTLRANRPTKQTTYTTCKQTYKTDQHNMKRDLNGMKKELHEWRLYKHEKRPII